jgi:AcrR family transcriptional regulator
MAKGRTTHLTPGEIATACLALFDVGPGEPTLRGLASELGASPKAIYHHYENREEIVQAAIDLVWEEAMRDLFTQIADPLREQVDPMELLVLGAVATRRAFGRHHRIAPHLGAAPPASTRFAGGLAILGAAFEQLGIRGERASMALYAYATYTLGSILLEANRRIADEAAGVAVATQFATSDLVPADAPPIDQTTAVALDHAIATTRTDRDVDEQLFVDGLRTLLQALVTG